MLETNMKTFIAGILIAMASFSSMAQKSAWSLSTVSNSNKEPVGYIYHVYAIGTMSWTRHNEQIASGLRFVCSTKNKEKAPPVVALFWNKPLPISSMQEINIAVDNIELNGKWYHEASLLYTSTINQSTLISAMKVGKIIKFSWVDTDLSKYTVAFDLKDFNLTSFNTACGIQL